MCTLPPVWATEGHRASFLEAGAALSGCSPGRRGPLLAGVPALLSNEFDSAHERVTLPRGPVGGGGGTADGPSWRSLLNQRETHLGPQGACH